MTIVKTEKDITKALEMIVAMTRTLLHLPDVAEIGVHVKPQNHQYVVTVEVAGFLLRKQDRTLSVALEDLLGDLSARVHDRLNEMQKRIDVMEDSEPA